MQSIYENKKIVIGTIVETGNMKGNYAVAEYFFNGISFKRKDGCSSPYIIKGEHFEVICDSMNPSESKIDFRKPVFLDTDVTDVVLGKVTSVTNYIVKYTYIVNNNKYEKIQECESCKKINTNESHTVRYLVSKPSISIIEI